MLPTLLARLGVQRPWLFGHSDGASIALLHAARHGVELSGIVVGARASLVAFRVEQDMATVEDGHHFASFNTCLPGI